MTVYVDELAQWGRPGMYRGLHAAQAERVGARHGHMWCHMFADEASPAELHKMARRIGLQPGWFQGDHYDLVPSKRAMAVRAGAVEVTREQSVAIWRKQKGKASDGDRTL